MKTLIEILSEEHPEAIVFSNHDFANAIIGITHDDRVVYNYDLMIESLIKNEKWTYEEAVDWIGYNTIRPLPYEGDKAPVIVYMMDISTNETS